MNKGVCTSSLLLANENGWIGAGLGAQHRGLRGWDSVICNVSLGFGGFGRLAVGFGRFLQMGFLGRLAVGGPKFLPAESFGDVLVV